MLIWVLALAAPVLAALMHGLQGALWVAGLGWLPSRLLSGELPSHWALASTSAAAVAALAGHLTDVRRRAVREAHARLARQAEQLEAQDRDMRVLRASHTALSERCDARDWSMAAAVEATRRAAASGDAGRSCAALLGLLESQARVRAAAVYLARPDGNLQARPSATLGPLRCPSSRHLTVRSAHQRGALVMPTGGTGGASQLDHEVLLAVPLRDSRGKQLGVVAVHDLPFVAHHDGHFALVATLVNAVADTLRRHVEPEAARPSTDRAQVNPAPADRAGAPRAPLSGLPPVPAALRVSPSATKTTVGSVARASGLPAPSPRAALAPPGSDRSPRSQPGSTREGTSSGVRAVSEREASGVRPTQPARPHAQRPRPLGRASGA